VPRNLGLNDEILSGFTEPVPRSSIQTAFATGSDANKEELDSFSLLILEKCRS